MPTIETAFRFAVLVSAILMMASCKSECEKCAADSQCRPSADAQQCGECRLCVFDARCVADVSVSDVWVPGPDLVGPGDVSVTDGGLTDVRVDSGLFDSRVSDWMVSDLFIWSDTGWEYTAWGDVYLWDIAIYWDSGNYWGDSWSDTYCWYCEWDYWSSDYGSYDYNYSGWDAPVYLPSDITWNLDSADSWFEPDWYWGWDDWGEGVFPFCDLDPYEDNNTAETATQLELDKPQNHTICPPGEEDYFRFQLTEPAAVDICFNTTDWNPLEVSLYDAGLNLLAYNDFPTVGYYCPLWGELLDMGAYYIRVDGSWWLEEPEYTIFLKD